MCVPPGLCLGWQEAVISQGHSYRPHLMSPPAGFWVFRLSLKISQLYILFWNRDANPVHFTEYVWVKVMDWCEKHGYLEPVEKTKRPVHPPRFYERWALCRRSSPSHVVSLSSSASQSFFMRTGFCHSITWFWENASSTYYSAELCKILPPDSFSFMEYERLKKLWPFVFCICTRDFSWIIASSGGERLVYRVKVAAVWHVVRAGAPASGNSGSGSQREYWILTLWACHLNALCAWDYTIGHNILSFQYCCMD